MSGTRRHVSGTDRKGIIFMDQTPNTTPAPEAPATEAVEPRGKSEMDHVLKDLHKFKAQAKDLEEKLKAKETEDLKISQRWKELAEIKERENSELKTKLDTKDKMIVDDKKFSALKDSALKAGLRKEALADLELVGLEDIAIETTSTGRINVIGADVAVERLKTMRPHWFSSTQAPSINLNQPGVTQGSLLTKQDVFKAEDEAKKTGDYTKYKAVLEQFRKQA